MTTVSRPDLKDKLKCFFGRHTVQSDCASKMYQTDDIETYCTKCDQKLLLKNDYEDSKKFHIIEI
jgi:hypothetical protein